MSIEINISADIAGARLMLDTARRKVLPQVERMTVNALAFDVMNAERLATKQVFKHPRPFTQKAFLVNQAKAGGEAEAMVYARPEADKYLAPYEFGGVHVLPGRANLVPIDARTDAYGQLFKGQMKRLEAMPNVFIGKVNGIMGVWQRVNITNKGTDRKRQVRGNSYSEEHGRLKLLIRFADAVPVTEHLEFRERAQMLVQSRFVTVFRRCMDKVMR